MITAIFVILACSAEAQQASDIERQGYVLDRTSSVAGVFNGCERGQAIRLRDGTVFTCFEHYFHYAFEPRVRLYRDALGQNWVFLLDDHAYQGSLFRPGLVSRSPAIGNIASGPPPLLPQPRPPPNPPLYPIYGVTQIPPIEGAATGPAYRRSGQ